MQLKALLLLTLASLAVSTPTPVESGTETSAARCGYPNGNCYENGCDGKPSTLRCSSGPYAGCECGYNCGSNVGSCYENGCEGVDGRCTGAYLGCNCR
ncbi:hypothetical protein HYALB_00008720 [Hymenoscyphus albidus]|uniref:Uncharacterized protein n=1 Tax=Hymenoscyphus albidus TaxID=595503 RepID=A0A9N9LLT9_9HELO|nr:hypothetical protein HYALB_00008720 [Hymenoscyphus albidus]